MTRDELVATLRARRAEWEALLAQIEPAHMTQPGAEDSWSVKDVLAHITAYEHWTADQLASLRDGETRIAPSAAIPPEGQTPDQDQRNAVIFAAYHEWPLERVREHAAREFARLVELVAALPEKVFTEETRYEWTFGLPLWKAIASDSYEHYAQHLPSLRAWAARHAA